ncbi:hypothetical protein C8R46DRAFT_885989, partial [Mycena filopes]
MSTKYAVVEELGSKAPNVTSGDLTQAVLREFEISFENYAARKGLSDAEQTAHALGCFKDFRLTQYFRIPDERKKLLAMTFADLMTTIRSEFLPKGWDRSLRIEMCNRRQGVNESFHRFATAVRETNSLLSDTPHVFTDDRLRGQLEANMLPELNEDCDADAAVKAETDFKAWLVEVIRVDDARIRTGNRLNAIAEQRERERERKRLATNDGDRDRKRNNNRENNPPVSSSSTSSSSSSSKPGSTPKLTPDETRLLDANHGCRRCRRAFVTHRGWHKICEFPVFTGVYKPVTQATIAAQRSALTP